VKADKGQLAQVIANLTLNAKEAMPTGGNFRIQAQNMPDIQEIAAPDLHGDFVKLTFRDEGIGIPARIIERIFDPYFTTKRAGSGLGLAIAHGIILKHKGHIRVDSQPNIGTTFTVFLPVDLNERPPTEPARVPVPESFPRASGHVLLLDDEELILQITSRMLVHLGYTVETARDGKDALLKYAAATKGGRPFDLVITDLTIPGGMGGKETIQDLLAINPSAKVIVSSGYSSDPVLANCGQYGFSGYLTKPFQLQNLKDELLRILTMR
jgi:CheY-like chemotaxis protein